MAMKQSIYYFNHNKMDLFLKQLTQEHPDTPQWDGALAQLHLSLRESPQQTHPSVTLVHEPRVTLSRSKTKDCNQSLFMDRSIWATLPARYKPTAKGKEDLQKGNYVTRAYELNVDDMAFTIQRLAVLREDQGLKSVITLDAYAIEHDQHMKPSERVSRFMRVHSSTVESHPSLSHFSDPHKALLHYYVMQLK
jgi:hypothetical protein